MSLTAIVLVLGSAIVHAGWNLIGRKARPQPVYYALASLTGVIALTPFLVIWAPDVRLVPADVWALLSVTGVFQAIYFTGLAGAYRNGDLSFGYPVARALPVALVPIVTALLGIGTTITTGAVMGIVVISAGLLIIVHPSFREVRLASYLRPEVRWALLAGIGTTGYSIIDSAALAMLRDALSAGSSLAQAPMIYIAFESLFTCVWLVLGSIALRGPRHVRKDLRSVDIRGAVLAGVGIAIAYGLVLAAYGFASNVSYVVAFRQVSLPIGTVFGIAFLKEHTSGPRIAGTLILLAGLTVVALA